MIRRYLVAGIVALLAVGVFFLVVLKPKLGDISDVREKIEAEQDTGQSLRAQLAQLRRAEQDAPATLGRLAAFEQLLPSTPDLPSLIGQLQTAAAASGIDLVSLAPSPPQTLAGATGIQSISVNLQVKGGFFRLESFLARLEKLQRVVEVISLSMAPAEDTATGLLNLTSTITMRMYVVQPNARLGGAAPAPSPKPTATP